MEVHEPRSTGRPPANLAALSESLAVGALDFALAFIRTSFGALAWSKATRKAALDGGPRDGVLGPVSYFVVSCMAGILLFTGLIDFMEALAKVSGLVAERNDLPGTTGLAASLAKGEFWAAAWIVFLLAALPLAWGVGLSVGAGHRLSQARRYADAAFYMWGSFITVSAVMFWVAAIALVNLPTNTPGIPAFKMQTVFETLAGSTVPPSVWIAIMTATSMVASVLVPAVAGARLLHLSVLHLKDRPPPRIAVALAAALLSQVLVLLLATTLMNDGSYGLFVK